MPDTAAPPEQWRGIHAALLCVVLMCRPILARTHRGGKEF